MKRNDTDTKGSGASEGMEGYDRRSFMAVAGVAGGFGAFARGTGASVSGFGERFAKNDAANDDADSDGDDEGDGNNEGVGDLPIGTEALVGYVEAHYGDRLSESDLESIEADIAADLEAAAAVSEVPLENSDAPAFGFAVYRGDE